MLGDESEAAALTRLPACGSGRAGMLISTRRLWAHGALGAAATEASASSQARQQSPGPICERCLEDRFLAVNAGPADTRLEF